MHDRRDRMLGSIDFANAVGVEIGALHAPMVSREDGKVLYVDYMPTAWLRDNLRHPGVLPADVVDVDVVWNGNRLADALGETVDYVVASHVIEHVPDLIGWLLQIAESLRPGGVLGLAIPDRRRTFDVCRNDSLPADVVAAHLESRARPSMQQVFDAGTFAAVAPEDRGWRAEHRSGQLPASVLHGLPTFYEWVRGDAGPLNRYVDVHCWVFTPESFLALAEALGAMGCFPFAIDGFYPTEAGSIEFQVRLRAIPNDGAAAALAQSLVAARGLLRPEPAAPLLAEAARAANVEQLIAENARLTGELSAMRGSRCWRATAPLRAVVRSLRAFTRPADAPAASADATGR